MTIRALVRALAACACVAAVAPPSSAQSPANTGHSGIAGVVRDTVGHPVTSARVIVDGVKQFATTDDSGRFDLRGLPSGRNGFTISKVGYAPVSFEASLLADSLIVVAIKMRPVNILNTVNVTALRTNAFLDRVGFADRRRLGWGDFLPPEKVDSMAPLVQSPAQLLRELTGVEVRCTPNCRITRTISNCVLSLWIDGVSWGTDQLDDHVITPSGIAAIEVYKHSGSVPAEYQSGKGSGCGAIVVWTKARVP